MKRQGFRFKSAVNVSYNRQGWIYFTSKLYQELPREQQECIRVLCRKAGGKSWRAVLERVTTDKSPAEICMKHFVSESTLERMVREYYREFDETM